MSLSNQSYIPKAVFHNKNRFQLPINIIYVVTDSPSCPISQNKKTPSTCRRFTKHHSPERHGLHGYSY